MLDGLDQVDWDHLSHAYGPATDVPDLLRALVDPDTASLPFRAAATKAKRDVRAHVIWTLWGNVFHQGTVWQVTSHVLPFFVEIVGDGPREVRAFAINYLHHCALGYPQDLFPRVIDPAKYFAIADQPDAAPDDPFSNTKMAGYARACYRAVESALPVIAASTADADDAIAEAAIAMLGSFHAGAPALRELAATSTGRRRALAVVALAPHDAARAGELARAVGQAAGDGRELAVLAAAALVLTGADDDEAVATLVKPLDELAKARCPLTTTLGALVSRVLVRMPDAHLDAVVHAMRATLASSDPLTNLDATGSLLEIVFKGATAPAQASALTPPQRAALEAIAEHGAFRIGDSGFGNYSQLLRRWGVPDDHAKLLAFLASERKGLPQ